MNTEFIRDDTFTCKYCDNTTLDPILNKRMPYYYKFPSCEHELCYACIEKLSHGHSIKIKDIKCNVCKSDIVKHDFINSNNPFKNELAMYYDHFTNMNNNFNNYTEGTSGDKSEKTEESKNDLKNNIKDDMFHIYAQNYNIMRIMSQYNMSLNDLVDSLPENPSDNDDNEN